MTTKRIPVFVYKVNPGQMGNGIYPMIACFAALGVHVPFTFLAHSENDYLQDVYEATPCDGSCKNRQGMLEDFAEKRSNTSFGVEEIVKKAMAYVEQSID